MGVPLQEVVERLGLGWGQMKALQAGGSHAAGAVQLSVLGVVAKSMAHELEFGALQRAMVVSVIFVGVVFGSFASGPLGDTLGRRIPLLWCHLIIITGSLCSCVMLNFWALLVCRVTIGFGFGIGVPASNTLISEITPAYYRLHMMAASLMGGPIGEMYSATLLMYFAPGPGGSELSWRWFVAAGTLPSCFFLVANFFTLSESPLFLAVQGRHDECQQVLEQLRHDNRMPDVDLNYVIVSRPGDGVSWHTTVRKNISIVFGRYLTLTAVVSMSMFVLNYVFYGTMYALPQVLAGMDLTSSVAVNLLMSAVMQLPGLLVGIALGLWLSRKWTVVAYLSWLLISTCMFVIAVEWYLKANFGEYMALGSLLSFRASVLCGWVGAYIFGVEIFPTVCRTTGCATCVGLGRLGAIAAPLAFELMLEAWGSASPFFISMIGLALINMCLVCFIHTDRKNQPLTDVQSHEHLPLMEACAAQTHDGERWIVKSNCSDVSDDNASSVGKLSEP